MTAIPRLARVAALAPLICGVPLAAWPQASGEAPGAQQTPAPDAQQALSSAASLPGTVVERNVFVPVDSSGHTGGEYIVVERRVVKKDGADAGGEVPTKFILVPQESDDEDATPNEKEDGNEEAPSQDERAPSQ
jgi:hypothetical protein